jgi:hypothetical protein
VAELASAGGVEGEVADELAVDEDVAGQGGDDHGGVWPAQADAEADEVSALGVSEPEGAAPPDLG